MVVFASESITSWLSLHHLSPRHSLPHTSRSRPFSRCATPSSPCFSGSARASPIPAPGRSPAGRSRPTRRSRSRSCRHLATKVDLREVSHLEQLGTWSEPAATPSAGSSRPRTSGSSRSASIRAIPDDTRWHPVESMPPTAFDHGAIVLAGRDRLRAKLSYSNIGFALAPETFTLAELRDVYEAALGYEVSATNLKRVLVCAGARSSRSGGGGRTVRRGAARPSSTASGSDGSRSPIRSRCSVLPAETLESAAATADNSWHAALQSHSSSRSGSRASRPRPSPPPRSSGAATRRRPPP